MTDSKLSPSAGCRFFVNDSNVSEKNYVFINAELKTPEEVIDFAINSGLDLYHNESDDWVSEDVISGKLKPEEFTYKGPSE